jgi:hypothetical protein
MAFVGVHTSRYRLEVHFSKGSLGDRSSLASLPVLRRLSRLDELVSELDAGGGSGRSLTYAVEILLCQGLWRRKAQVGNRGLGVRDSFEVGCIRGCVADSSPEHASADGNGGTGR